jgi:hypothetical protein
LCLSSSSALHVFLFLSTPLLAGMTGISSHMQWRTWRRWSGWRRRWPSCWERWLPSRRCCRCPSPRSQTSSGFLRSASPSELRAGVDVMITIFCYFSQFSAEKLASFLNTNKFSFVFSQRRQFLLNVWRKCFKNQNTIPEKIWEN